MPDLYAHNPGGDSAGRQLRARHAELAELVDRVRRPTAGGTAGRLVQVYNGGAIPTGQADKFYLTRPVELDGTETEAGSYTPTADTTQTIPVVILGTAAAAGDLVVAHAIGGRWVAERRQVGTPLTPCGICDIPTADLTITETGTGTFAGDAGSYALVHGVGPLGWETAVSRRTFGSHSYYYWDFGCSRGDLLARYYSSLTGLPGSFVLGFSTNPADGGGTMLEVSRTCGTMFAWSLHFCVAGNCAIGEWTWTITYP